mmetsp:Transcript_19919/g.41005  ORF Transcript_19919/g.41005 Transcript_19919/m.41005 type:complete len:82 (-) Transcript_19919:103-348(-)
MKFRTGPPSVCKSVLFFLSGNTLSIGSKNCLQETGKQQPIVYLKGQNKNLAQSFSVESGTGLSITSAKVISNSRPKMERIP